MDATLWVKLGTSIMDLLGRLRLRKRNPVAAKILIVDDDPQFSKLLRLTLENKGYACDAVRTADDALDAIRRLQPALVFVDVGLIGKDGWELAKEIKLEFSKARVWIMTGGDTSVDLGRKKVYIESGYAVGFIGKSVNWSAYEDAIKFSGL